MRAAGIMRDPTESWMTQMARNAVDESGGAVRRCRYVLHDRDTKFCAAFDEIFASERRAAGPQSSRPAFFLSQSSSIFSRPISS